MSPRLAVLLPDLGKGVRAAIATVVPFFLARQLGRPELAWVALGGWLASLADPGGTRRARATGMAVFIAAGTAAVALGAVSAFSPVTSALVVAATVFVTSMARALGGIAATIGTMIAIIAAIAAQATGSPPLATAGLFALGALWAVALSSIVWPGWPHLPLRHAVARVYDQLADYVDAIAAAVRSGETDPDAWAALGRDHQRPIRTELEAASTMMVALRARRIGESPVGANTRTILGEAEAEFFKLIGYADELEARAEAHAHFTGDVATLAELATSYREIRDQLVTRKPGTWKPTTPVASPSQLAHKLVTASRLVVDVSRDLDVVPRVVGELAAPPRVASPTATAARDALSWHSPIFHHAVRLTATAVIALVVGRIASPRHAQWVSITALAVQQPYLGPTIVRVVERVIGTVIGCALAIGLIGLLATPIATAAAMFPLAVVSVVTRPRSYRLFVLFLTPVFLLVADRWHPSLETALVRMLDVAIGGAIAVVAAMIGPSWERTRLPDALVGALDAVIGYVSLSFAILPDGDRGKLADARRTVGIALETAEASLERMLAEPRQLQRGTADAMFLLTYARRISTALTALDELLAVQTDATRPVLGPETRDYLVAELEAAKRFVATGATTAVREPPHVDPALDRLVHHGELVGRIARPKI